METVTTSLTKKNNSSKFIISFLIFLVLISIGFFIARGLMKGENISETETSASDAEDKVNYALGEILVSFKNTPQLDVTTQLQKISNLSDLKLKRKINSKLYLYESPTLRNNSIVGINAVNSAEVFTSGKWGKLDSGMNKTLIAINSNSGDLIPEFEYAEPNYKVQTFTR
jgi:hypothetical protein